MSSMTFNPKKLIRGIFRRNKPEKGSDEDKKDHEFSGGLKGARSCPFVHVHGEGQENQKFESRLSLWMDGESGASAPFLSDEVMVRSPHHSQRLSTDLLLICQSRCDNPVVRDLLNDDSWEAGADEISPPSAVSLSPRPASLALSPRSIDLASVRSHEEAILGSEAIHPYLIRSPPPILARTRHQDNVFIFPADVNSRKSTRCMSEVLNFPSMVARNRDEAGPSSLDVDLKSLPLTPRKSAKGRAWSGRSVPDVSDFTTPTSENVPVEVLTIPLQN